MERQRPFLSSSVNRDLDSKSCWRVHWATGGAGGWWGEAREQSDPAVATQALGTSSLCILQSSGKMPAPLQLIPHSSAAACISELLGRIVSTRVHGLCVCSFIQHTLIERYHGPDTILDTEAEQRTKERKFSAPRS